MPKSIGARTHPCLTPLLMGKGSEEVYTKTIIHLSVGEGGV